MSNITEQDWKKKDLLDKAKSFQALADIFGNVEHAKKAIELRDKALGKRIWKIQSGKPSWHQQKAGHTYASTLILRATEMHIRENFIKPYLEEGIPFDIRETV